MENRAGRHAALTKRLLESVLATSGHTATKLRRAVFARAFGPHPLTTLPLSPPLSGTERGTGGEDIAPDLAAYVDKVAQHAHKVTDEDLAALKRAGNSDDVLFEATVSAALGAALGRLERGLSALRGEGSPPDPPSPTWGGGTRDENRCAYTRWSTATDCRSA